MRVTYGGAGRITLNWIPTFNQHIFFSFTTRERLGSEVRVAKGECMNDSLNT